MISHHKRSGQDKFLYAAQMGLPVFWSGKDEVKSAEECRKQRVISAAYKMWSMHCMMRGFTEVDRRKQCN